MHPDIQHNNPETKEARIKRYSVNTADHFRRAVDHGVFETSEEGEEESREEKTDDEKKNHRQRPPRIPSRKPEPKR